MVMGPNVLGPNSETALHYTARVNVDSAAEAELTYKCRHEICNIKYTIKYALPCYTVY